MSIDWLPEEDRRRFPDNVYTEPCWTRTEKGILRNRKRDLKNLYDIFEIYKKKGRVIAEGICNNKGRNNWSFSISLYVTDQVNLKYQIRLIFDKSP